MKWAHETWLKIYKNPGAKWLSLPVSARGLGRELLLYADADGRIFTGTEKRAAAIARMLGAHAGESKRIADDVRWLLLDGYLVEDGDSVVIRNYVEAQERITNSAQRTRRWREKNAAKASQEASHVTDGDASHVTPVTSRVTDKRDGVVSCRVDPCRVDPTPSPSPGGEGDGPSAGSVAVDPAPKAPPNRPHGLADASAPSGRVSVSTDVLREARAALQARGRLL